MRNAQQKLAIAIAIAAATTVIAINAWMLIETRHIQQQLRSRPIDAPAHGVDNPPQPP